MKKSGECPKCGCVRLLVNERVGFKQKMYKGQDIYVAPIPVQLRTKSEPGMLYGTNETIEELGTFRSITCAGCGYTELYAENMPGLPSGT